MKTPSLPEAAKLAREMLKRCQRDGLTDEEWKATLAALDAALAASAEPREPVAWRHSHTHCLYETEDEVELADGDSWAEPLYLAPPAQAEPSAQEPADTVPTRGGLSVKEFSRSIEAMIATPTPQTSAQEPAFHEAIMQLRGAWATLTNLSADMDATPLRAQMQKRAGAIRACLDKYEQADGTYAATPQPLPPSPEQAQAKQDVQAVPEGFVLTDEQIEAGVSAYASAKDHGLFAAWFAFRRAVIGAAPTSPACGAAPPVQGEPLTLALKLAADRTREDLGSDTQETNYPHVRELLRFVEAAISNEGVDK